MAKHRERQVRLQIDEAPLGYTWTVCWIPVDECPKVGETYDLRGRTWVVYRWGAEREYEDRP